MMAMCSTTQNTEHRTQNAAECGAGRVSAIPAAKPCYAKSAPTGSEEVPIAFKFLAQPPPGVSCKGADSFHFLMKVFFYEDWCAAANWTRRGVNILTLCLDSDDEPRLMKTGVLGQERWLR